MAYTNRQGTLKLKVRVTLGLKQSSDIKDGHVGVKLKHMLMRRETGEKRKLFSHTERDKQLKRSDRNLTVQEAAQQQFQRESAQQEITRGSEAGAHTHHY